MYILAGGSDLTYPEYGKRLGLLIGNEILNPKILSCMFAVAENERESKHAMFDPWFSDNFKTDYEIAHADEIHFIKQVQSADVIYIHGGSTDSLLKVMAGYNKDIQHFFKNKIVIGSSAGANYLSRVGFSPKKHQLVYGAAIIDVGVVVHYGVNEFHGSRYDAAGWHIIAESVQKKVGNRSTLLLPEGEFAILYKDENH